MNQKIYVLTGLSADYDDFVTWKVKAFTDKTRADEYCGLAQKRADDIYNKLSSPWHYDPNSRENQYDPKMEFRGHGTAEYTVEELELVC